jgi:predicted transcriptional regulator
MIVDANLTELTAVIVASFVSNNTLTAVELPALIASTHEALALIDTGPGPPSVDQTPAVPIEDSVTRDYLICLNDGRKLKSLKRYLQRKYSLSPAAYRDLWHLPEDYPMVAPAYAELRSKIAKRKVAEEPIPAGRRKTASGGSSEP